MPEENGVAGTEEGGSAGGASGDAGAQTFDVVVDGETVQVSREDLVGGYLRQSDYTKKTTALSEREKAMDKHIEDKATELYLQAQAESRENGGDGGGDNDQGQAKDGSEDTQRESKLNGRLEKLEQSNLEARQEEENRETDGEIAGIMEGIKKKYPLADERLIKLRVHEEIQDHDDVQQVFDRIASEEHEGIKKRDLSTIDEYIKTKRTPHASGETGSSTSGVGGKTPKPPMTFEEARASARERLGAL